MARTLDVYLHEELVGHLIQDDDGQMSFEYLESWLAKPGAVALSQSLPLRKKRFPARNAGDFRRHFAGREQTRNHRPQSGHQRAQRLRHA